MTQPPRPALADRRLVVTNFFFFFFRDFFFWSFVRLLAIERRLGKRLRRSVVEGGGHTP